MGPASPGEPSTAGATPALVLSSSVDEKRMKYVKQVSGRHNDSELHLAARRGDLAAVMRILRDVGAQMTETAEGAEVMSAVVNETNDFEETAMMTAAEKGQLGVVAELLKYSNKASISRKNRSGFDAFHVAVKGGHQDIARLLLSHDPTLGKTFGPSNVTPLISAAARGHTQVIKLLLAQNFSMV
ncbi:unnamed protein product [Musa acuminata subsp. burmannicoides]